MQSLSFASKVEQDVCHTRRNALGVKNAEDLLMVVQTNRIPPNGTMLCPILIESTVRPDLHVVQVPETMAVKPGGYRGYFGGD
jgi:hypothetical protein